VEQSEDEAQYTMKCPHCDVDLVPGTAFIKGTFLGFLAIGLSHQHLWFRRDDDLRRQKIIYSGDEKPGHQCIVCGAVVIAGFRLP
jgi:hypothetical protein